MSRTRKGLKAPYKKTKKRRVNPAARIQGKTKSGEFFIDGEALSAQDLKTLEAMFGPPDGRIVGVFGNL